MKEGEAIYIYIACEQHVPYATFDVNETVVSLKKIRILKLELLVLRYT